MSTGNLALSLNNMDNVKEWAHYRGGGKAWRFYEMDNIPRDLVTMDSNDFSMWVHPDSMMKLVLGLGFTFTAYINMRIDWHRLHIEAMYCNAVTAFKAKADKRYNIMQLKYGKAIIVIDNYGICHLKHNRIIFTDKKLKWIAL